MHDRAASASGELVLTGPITVYTVITLRELLQKQLEIPGVCLINAAGVTELDAGGAALLGAFVLALTRRAKTVQWVTVSARLLANARALHMESWLGLPGPAAAGPSL